MRVISGIAKGHKLKAPKGNKVRPTEDRIKESIFNILGNIKKDSVILDAFGGTGGIGIEFLSRGAKKSVFVDNYSNSINIIIENLVHTKLLERAEILKSDIFVALKRFNKDNLKFDYIYLDPPFNKGDLVDKLLSAIERENILAENGIILIEHERELELEDCMYSFLRCDIRKYGSKSIDFYKIKTEVI